MRSNFSLIAVLVASSSTFAAVGVPLHGHRSHSGHEQPHLEVGHHDHDSSYAQGEERVVPRVTRDVALPTVAPILSAEISFEARIEPPRTQPAVGRAPPDPSSPRAPPA